MHFSTRSAGLASIVSAICCITPVLAQADTAIQKGFNYGATFEDGRCRTYEDFVSFFNTAKTLTSTSGFSSARLYTTIQCGTPNSPISAIPAAIDTDTSILLGLWASAGGEVFANEVAALQAAINQYGQAFTDRVVGISVGSEDLYRSSPEGQANNAGIGATADTINGYIGWLRDVVRGTPLEGKPIGHVDTWTAWIRPENAVVAESVDWLGHNSFPYFEATLPNSIEESAGVFWNAYGNTESVSRGKPVWVTETGWPTTGPASNLAVPSVQNAQSYWRQVGCELFDNKNTWWYTLTDANTAQTDISFGIVEPGTNAPIFDLTCGA